jgi:recombination associated protein RdgC
MFFRNLVLFRYPRTMNTALAALEERLSEHPLKPVGPLELGSRGFVPPMGAESSALVIQHPDAYWITLGGEDRMLPSAVVNDALAKKLVEIETREGRKLGGRARKQLKDDLVHEMLPKAFVRSSRTSALILPSIGYVVVDASSRKRAESVLSELRHAMGSFPAIPVNAEVSPRAVLTSWLVEGTPDGSFEGDKEAAGWLRLGDECVLVDPVDGGAVVRAQRQELTSDEITKHLETGKQVKRLALSLDGHVEFTLDEDLVIRKVKLLDDVVDKLENTERDSLAAELDARLALFTGEVKNLLGVLERQLRFSSCDDGPSSERGVADGAA